MVWYEATLPHLKSNSNEALGRAVVCYNCRQKIALDDLRITTNGIVKGEAAGSYSPVVFSFHAASLCLLDWSYHQMGKRRNTLAPFGQKVAVAAGLKLQPQHQQQLIELSNSGISIISQTFATYNYVPGTPHDIEAYSDEKILFQLS
jgi:hypothetical protein